MADDVKDSEEGEDAEKKHLLLQNHLKRINIEDGEISTKTEEQYGLRDKGIMIRYHPPKSSGQ